MDGHGRKRGRSGTCLSSVTSLLLARRRYTPSFHPFIHSFIHVASTPHTHTLESVQSAQEMNRPCWSTSRDGSTSTSTTSTSTMAQCKAEAGPATPTVCSSSSETLVVGVSARLVHPLPRGWWAAAQHLPARLPEIDHVMRRRRRRRRAPPALLSFPRLQQ
jgi:hypothetical protein